MIKNNKTVFVGVSGGVDSSVSAAILIEQGYNVVGVFIRTWTPDFIKCTWEDERRDAMRVCAHLGIPFLECDAEKEYKEGVADYMIEEYKKGNTPNPDVMCNREVKFGVFWKFAKEYGADAIATGHYAQNNYPVGDSTKSRTKIKNYELKKGIDNSKDQSYFLWTLKQEDLAHTLFPIGHLEKSEVRKIALKYKLPTAVKKDSQGVCFLGPLDMKDFLGHYIESKKGDVLLAPKEPGDNKREVIGTHDGAVFFTLGERHGFTLTKHSENDKPLYVVAKNVEDNTITVSENLINNTPEQFKKYNLEKTNWISVTPEDNKIYKAQIRYHGEYVDCDVKILDKNTAIINFDKPMLVSSGQSIVVYYENVCLGGGVVSY
ncbi:MAG: tRNA 2-thiouridine(34) synthase MnmA [Candidatus Pacebacteria bacterium]|nr:tRNA 2-thiouridine(34) synthase MnmA [Candidatus Paceibacterota bacterium]